MPFGEIARAIERDETAGLMKLIIDPDDERILGATHRRRRRRRADPHLRRADAGGRDRASHRRRRVRPSDVRRGRAIAASMRLARYALDFESAPTYGGHDGQHADAP